MLDDVHINVERVKSGFASVYDKYIDQAHDSTHANYWNAQETAQEQKRALERSVGTGAAVVVSTCR